VALPAAFEELPVRRGDAEGAVVQDDRCDPLLMPRGVADADLPALLAPRRRSHPVDAARSAVDQRPRELVLTQEGSGALKGIALPGPAPTPPPRPAVEGARHVPPGELEMAGAGGGPPPPQFPPPPPPAPLAPQSPSSDPAAPPPVERPRPPPRPGDGAL